MTKRVHIIGSGIVGLCTAWYLQRAGCEVCVIDRNDFSDGTSFGNAGMIVPSHFVPMSTPGVIAQGLKWLLNSKSPFHIRPRLSTDLIQWLWHFYRSATVSKVKVAMPVLYELNEQSKLLYQAMALESELDFGFKAKGLLMLYKTAKQAQEEKELAEKAHELGVEAKILTCSELKTLEPEMELDVLGGIYFPGDAHLHPNQLMVQLRQRLAQLGVSFLSNTTVVDFNYRGSKIESISTAAQETIAVNQVILASGSWTGALLKKAGMKIHLQAGKGYSMTLEQPALCPRIPTILSEAKVAITPMGNSLRIGGTLELGNLSKTISKKRVQGIIESVPAYYHNLSIPSQDEAHIWQGYRPCTPDGLPYIGQSASLSNLFVGTGHGMMGLSLGAITGKVLSELIIKQTTSLPIQPFRLDRF